MESNKKTARIAGLLYLFLAITGAYGIAYVPSKIIVTGDILTTANNIMTHEMLYRIGILCQLICQTLFVYLVLTLYRLLKEVNKNYATQMVALVIVSVPIAFVNTLNQIAALILLKDANFLTTFQPDQLNTLVMIFFNLYEQGIIIVQIFWGLWLLPFGLLVYKSSFIPRLIGVFLILGGIGYVVASLTNFLYPQYGLIVDNIATIPSMIGEFSIILWLLIVGVKNQQPSTVAAT